MVKVRAHLLYIFTGRYWTFQSVHQKRRPNSRFLIDQTLKYQKTDFQTFGLDILKMSTRLFKKSKIFDRSDPDLPNFSILDLFRTFLGPKTISHLLPRIVKSRAYLLYGKILRCTHHVKKVAKIYQRSHVVDKFYK
jgi:hypothetical protein